MSDPYLSTSWPFLAAGAIVFSCLVVKRNYTNQTRNLLRLQRENDQLKAEIETLKRQNDLLKEKLKEDRESSSESTLVATLQKELEQTRKHHKELEKSVGGFRKQEFDWEQIRNQLSTENQHLKEQLSKLQKLTEENDKLKKQVQEYEKSSEQSLQEFTKKIDEFKKKFESSEFSRLEQQKLNSQETLLLKGKVSTLENAINDYKQQLKIEREKLDKLSNNNNTSTNKTEDTDMSVESTPRSAASEDEGPPPYLPEQDQTTEDRTDDKTENSEDTPTPRSTDSRVSNESDDNDIPPPYLEKHTESEGSVTEEEPPTYNNKELSDIATTLNLPDASEELNSDLDLSKFKKFAKSKTLSAFDNDQLDDLKIDLTKLKKKEKVPAFMSLFKSPDEVKAEKEARKPWSAGSPVVRDFGVREDANQKGTKKSRRAKGMSFGSTKTHDMEDTHYLSFPLGTNQNQGLFCIFDGHGGVECAASAREIFPTQFAKVLAGNQLTSDASEILRQTFLTVDQLLEEYEYMGCTGTAVFVWEHEGNRYIQAANVGDSTAFIKIDQNVIWLTRDHKASNPAERQRIQQSGGELTSGQTRVMGGLAVSRAFGDHFLKKEKVGLISEPFISEAFKITNDVNVVLASDGLWDVMSGEEAMQNIENIEDATSAARHLVSVATANPKCTDNITVAVVYL